MYYLTSARILRINGKVLGGEPALRDWGFLDSAANRPMAAMFGEEAYPTVTEKAAALLHSLVLNHPFVDGNKRTATAAMIQFLKKNGVRPNWQPEQALEFIVAVAEGKHDVPAITAWLNQNTTPIS